MSSIIGRAIWSSGIILLVLISSSLGRSQTIWVEGESSSTQTVHPHPWYGSVDREQLSGGDFISHFHQQPGSATFQVSVDQPGEYRLWIRANHVASKLEYQLNGSRRESVSMATPQQAINIATDGKPDLRFLSWIDVGPVILKAGENQLTIHMVSDNNNHGALDCLVLSRDGFVPNGKWKPGQKPDIEPRNGWFVFYPDTLAIDTPSILDLRYLNQQQAGQDGRVIAKDGQFRFAHSDQPVRFWAVNGPPHQLTGEALQRCARRLARYGVNLVRVHQRVFTPAGDPDLANVAHCQEIVRAMKAEGIYVHFSVYFPLWFQPKPGLPGLEGYDGNQHPFASLYFNREFQQRYRAWLAALLQTPDDDQTRLLDEPAVLGIELVNEDSLFFWTFNKDRIPDSQFQKIEQQFHQWLKGKYGTIEKAFQHWKSGPLDGDLPNQGRMAIRPLWNIANQRTLRDQDTASFLAEVQYRFYQQTHQYLDQMGFKGLVTCSNWHTASPQYLDPLERLSYTAGDFMDRHGYFSGLHQGDAASYSIREQHVYTNRSALRFDPSEPGKPKDFTHPAMDLHYLQMPSMISETTFNRPNRFRSEGPLFFAAYGSLQDTDAIVHFAYDSDQWAVQTGGINPWTLSTPAMMGQFPAAALIYRNRMIETPPPVAQIQLNLDDVKGLKGTPLPQGASFDQLRAADLPAGEVRTPSGTLDPLLHLVGPTLLQFTTDPTSVQWDVSNDRINRQQETVVAANDQLELDFGKGILKLDAPLVQAVSGNLAATGPVQLSDIRIESRSDLIHIAVVALDNQPISDSGKMLLQVMTEELPTNREVQDLGKGRLQITSLGSDPWQVKTFQGTVQLPDRPYRITPLDANGIPMAAPIASNLIELQPETLYYLIER